MSDTSLTCPNCGHAFPLTDALAAQLRGEVEAALIKQHRAQVHELAERVAQAEAREVESRRRALELERAQTLAIERARLELEAKLRAEAEQRLAQEQTRLRSESDLRVRQLQAQINETRAQLQAAQAAELKLRQRAEAIVDAFAAMKGDLDRERRAMERIWKEREKQLERVLAATAGMYGELRGTIGQSMPAIAALELDGAAAASLPPLQS